jgi:hypothetical protein
VDGRDEGEEDTWKQIGNATHDIGKEQIITI